MDKEARDVSTCIATAARKLGYYAENVSDYIDDPDRTNCLVRKYARFADEPILDRFVYENPHPDWVVLIEETIIKAVNFFRGTPPAQGVLVINSARDPQYLLKFLPENMLAKLDKLVVVDGPGWPSNAAAAPGCSSATCPSWPSTGCPPKARWSAWPSAGASPRR